MVYDCNAKAMNPFEREAKHIFSPVAAPMWGDMCFVFSTAARCEPERGAEERGVGVERGREGRDQDDPGGASPSEEELGLLGEGGPPIMPPSMKRISSGELDLESDSVGVGGERGRVAATLWMVEGEMALRSRK